MGSQEDNLSITESEAAQDLTFDQLYSDLVEAERLKAPPDDSFTAAQFAESSGLAETTAMRRLKKLVTEGNLESGIFIDGRERRFFWFVDAAA